MPRLGEQVASLACLLAVTTACGGAAPAPPVASAASPSTNTGPAFDTIAIARTGDAAPPVSVLDAAGSTDSSIVFTMRGTVTPTINVSYASGPVMQCGSGEPVEVDGEAILLVRLFPVDAHVFDGENASSTIADRNRTLPGPLLRQMTMICDFEAQVEWVIGLSRRVGFRLADSLGAGRFVIEFDQR